MKFASANLDLGLNVAKWKALHPELALVGVCVQLDWKFLVLQRQQHRQRAFPFCVLVEGQRESRVQRQINLEEATFHFIYKLSKRILNVFPTTVRAQY